MQILEKFYLVDLVPRKFAQVVDEVLFMFNSDCIALIIRDFLKSLLGTLSSLYFL